MCVRRLKMRIYDMLYDWQRKIVDQVKDRQAYGLFLDCGLGKTPLSLACAEQHECTKLIIISINAKASEKVDKKGSFLWWAYKGIFNGYDILDKKSKPEECDQSRSQILIMNYESLFVRNKEGGSAPMRPILASFVKSCAGCNTAIIIDESHSLKNYSSQRTKTCIQMQKQLMVCTRKHVWTYLLTGTPFTTGYIDLWTQLKMLGCPMSKTAYIERFAIRDNRPGLLGFQQPIIGYRNVEELYGIVHQYAITIKSDTVVKLPEQIFVEHTYEKTQDFTMLTSERLPGNDVLMYCMAKNVRLQDSYDAHDYSTPHLKNNPFYRNIAYPSLEWLAETAGALWLRARQLSIGFQGNSERYAWYSRERLDMLERFLAENPDNYVLFYTFTPELFEIFAICDRLGYDIDVLSGDIKSTHFYDTYAAQTPDQQFNNRKNIFILNWQTGSTGLNLQEYSKCIIFDYPVFRDWQQGLARLRRLGQKAETVVYHVFSSENWLDQGMRQAINEQRDYTDDTFASDLHRVNGFLGRDGSDGRDDSSNTSGKSST